MSAYAFACINAPALTVVPSKFTSRLRHLAPRESNSSLAVLGRRSERKMSMYSNISRTDRSLTTLDNASTSFSTASKST